MSKHVELKPISTLNIYVEVSRKVYCYKSFYVVREFII